MLAHDYDSKHRASAQGVNIARRPEKLDKAFGGRVKDAMRREGIGTKALATEAGVHPVTVSGWRRGRKPGPAQVKWLAGRLKTPFKWLNSAEGPSTESAPSAQAQPSASAGAGNVLREVPLEDYRRNVEELAELFGFDPATADPGKVLRAAGYWFGERLIEADAAKAHRWLRHVFEAGKRAAGKGQKADTG